MDGPGILGAAPGRHRPVGGARPIPAPSGHPFPCEGEGIMFSAGCASAAGHRMTVLAATPLSNPIHKLWHTPTRGGGLTASELPRPAVILPV